MLELERLGPRRVEEAVRQAVDARCKWLRRLFQRIDRSAQGLKPRFIGTLQDITDAVQAEEQLRRVNQELEQRVTERTEALSKSNKELSTAMATLQRAQIDLVQSEKLAALGSLVAGIAHELNTPVGNSLMAASTLEDHSREIAAAVSSTDCRRLIACCTSMSKSWTPRLARSMPNRVSPLE